MFQLKSLTPEGIPAALEKAFRYRLLNEPEQAESICEDILAVDPDNQEALAALILAHTDRFAGPRPVPPQDAKALLPKLSSEYDRAYFAGIIEEREGIAWLRSDKPRSGFAAYSCFRAAMRHFEAAEKLRPPANDDALLRWNSCARMILANEDVAPADEGVEETVAAGD
jgi:tetratricopeptide (TPR) repeat protein